MGYQQSAISFGVLLIADSLLLNAIPVYHESG
jgi:hypothetical protein